VITPMHKKGDTSDMRNYKRISLLCTAYKIYAAILAERLREEIEEKRNLLVFQAGQGSEREELIDNVMILQQIINTDKQNKRESIRVLHRFKGSL